MCVLSCCVVLSCCPQGTDRAGCDPGQSEEFPLELQPLEAEVAQQAQPSWGSSFVFRSHIRPCLELCVCVGLESVEKGLCFVGFRGSAQCNAK